MHNFILNRIYNLFIALLEISFFILFLSYTFDLPINVKDFMSIFYTNF